jgi:branched-chain amino acid transport system substrate-binding protein
VRSRRLWALAAATGALAALAGLTAPVASAGGGPSCTTATIGFAMPITGPAAVLGRPQLNWANQGLADWNKTHKVKLRAVQGDTQLPKTSEAIKVARQFASNRDMLAVVGLAGSQENVAVGGILERAGFAWVSPSATRVSLTDDGKLKGNFFRVVPNDGPQSRTVEGIIVNKLGVKSGDTVVIVDDQEAYGLGLSDAVQKLLEARGVTVQRESINPDPAASPDYSSLAAKVPSNAKVVYIPWQLPGSGQAFGQALKEQGKSATIVGSDGLFDPKTFKINGSWLSFFATVTSKAVLNAHVSRFGGPQYFGAPSYVAVQVVGSAIEQACADGTATRDEVRRNIARTNLRTSIMGIPIRFAADGDLTVQRFFIFEVVGGSYVARPPA